MLVNESARKIGFDIIRMRIDSFVKHDQGLVPTAIKKNG
jgi:hypothetical protein